MKEQIEKMYIQALIDDLPPNVFADQVLRLFDVSGRHSWLQKDDLEFAIALQEKNRLEAVKWLCEKARGHSLTPLRDAKDILDAYR